MKKIISLILAIALMAVPFCGITFTASAESTNLVVNGTFDDGLNGWTVLDQPEGSTATGETATHPGWDGFNATAPYLSMIDYDAGVSQEIAVTAGAYKLTYKYATTGGASNLIVLFNDVTNGGTPFYEATDVHSDGKLVSVTKLVTFDADITARLRFSTENASKQVLIDDVTLTKLEDERVVNGDFADGATGWTSSNTVFENEAANIKFWSNAGQGLTQSDIVLVKGEAYEFKFDIAAVAAENSNRTVYARVMSGDTVIASTSLAASTTAGVWKQGIMKFFAEETYTNATINIYAPNSSNGDNGTYVDNVSLKKIDLDGELVYNGNFDATWAWSGWTTNQITITASDNAMFWSGSNSSLSTTIAVEKGRTYKISYNWLSAHTHNMNIAVSMDGTSLYSNTWSTYVSSSAYVGRSHEFIAEKTGIAQLTITAPTTYGTTKFKNISVIATTEKPTAERVVNGGFDTTDNWTVFWNTTSVQAISEYANEDKVGNNGIQIQNYAGGFEQSITVVKDTQYKLSFLWAPCASGGATSSVRVSIADTSFGGSYDSSLDFMFNKTVSSQNYRYEEYSAIFTADKTGTVVLRFDRMSCASVPIVIDDVSVKEFTTAYSVDFNSETVTIDDNYIYGATDVESVLSGFTLSDNATVTCNSNIVRTGAKVTVKVEGAEYMTYEMVVMGDVNGDAECNLLDLVAAKKQASGTSRLSGAYFKAACFTDDDVINGDDLIPIKQSIIG